ncbi:MAG TPA: DUF362 domain-containing protein [Planctomycetes bacterium]|nr:DUF362 domain-containing protein [Planctomycetota bacterium]HIK82888.1 DUF362 domain-containing protein [Planctomycetota bacterium]
MNDAETPNQPSNSGASSSPRKKPIQHPEYQKAPMERRVFLGRLGAAAGLLGTAGYLSLAPEKWPLSLRDSTGLLSKPVLKPVRLDDFRVAKPIGQTADVGIGRGGTPDQMLRKALDAVGGVKHYIQPGDIVLVKPNVAFDRAPALGATSQPALIEALIQMLLVDCRAQEVRVCDNPIESPSDCFMKTGLRKATEKAGGRVYLPDPNSFKQLNTPGATLIEEWAFFHRPFTNVDKVIGVAPVKDHNLCFASMGIKNWYGLLGGRRNQFHQDIHEIVSDLSIMIRPTLTILDGTKVLMENGPTGGDPSNVVTRDVVMASLDPVAQDAWAFQHLLQRDPHQLPEYLHKAELKGAGRVDFEGRLREIT